MPPELDPARRDELIKLHTPLVTALVGRFRFCGQEREDLQQIGMMGLLRAIRNFDESRGLCFSTYAVPVILGEIRRYLRDDGPIKVSRSLKEAYLKLRAAETRLEQRNGEAPTISELCEETGLSRETALQALEGGARPLSLETPIGEGTALTLADTVPTAETTDQTDLLALREGIGALGVTERRIVVLRYFYDRTQQQTAEALGMTQVQVSRKEKKILQTLRARFLQDEASG